MSLITRIWKKIQLARFCLVHRGSLASIKRYQEKKIRAIMQYASTHIPFWRARLEGVTELAEAPFVSKRDYITTPVDEYIDTTHRVFQLWSETSGTSGTPFRALVARLYAGSAFYMDFASYRFLWWRGESIESLKTTKVASIKIKARTNQYRMFVSVSDFQTDRKKVYEQLRDFAPRIVVAYPSVLFELGRWIEKEGLMPLRFEFALSFGEMLSSEVRGEIEKYFSCEVYDRYGLQEIGVIGLECKQHSGFHINVESVRVEILDDNGAPVDAGQKGRIVVTDLLNTNMPFIRYETGDRGSVTEAPCACGLYSPRLWVEGRFTASLAFGERVFHHLELDATVDQFMGEVLQYQFVKKSETAISVLLVPGPRYSAATARRVEQSVQGLVGNSITVTATLVQAIARAPSGKSQIVADETIAEV